MGNELIQLKNSSYAKGRKYIVDAEQLMHNFKVALDSVGTTALKDIIEATGQIYNPLVSSQLINAITQLILASNYFKDIGSANTVVLDAYTPGYGIPTQYVSNMVVKFRPAFQNTGATTISFKGLQPVKVLTDMFAELSAGSLIPTRDYSVVYNEDKGAFILSSSVEDSGSLALNEIRNLIESAGLTFSTALDQQLMQAVSLYSLQHTYSCVSNQSNIAINNYVLQPQSTFVQIPKYVDGMVIRFRPTFNNTLTNPTIQVYGMSRYPLVYSDGDIIPEGSISTNSDVVVKFSGNTFYLVSNGLTSLKLQSGPVVKGISNDVSLVNSSQNSLVTEFAVKSYVDAKSTSKRNYAVSSGNTDSSGLPNFLEKTSDTVITIKAGVFGQPSYNSIVSASNAVASPSRPDDEEDPEDIITFGIGNCFDGNNTTYYETKDVGSIVAGKKNAMVEGEYEIWPNYVGATELNDPISLVKLLGRDTSTLPRSVFFQYSIDGVNWQDVGTQTYQEADPSGQIITKVKRDIFSVDYSTGEFTNIPVSITPYVNNVNPDLGVSYPYSVRCYANEFTNQNNGWQLVSYEFCVASEEIKPLVLTYSDGTSEIINDKLTVSISGLPDGEATILKTYGGNFEVVSNDLYVESSTEPTPQEGLYWVDILLGSINTYKYIDQDGSLIKENRNFVKVGTVSIKNGVIDKLYPCAFNGELHVSNITLSNPTIIEHNLGSLNTVKMYIVCSNPDGGYVYGDTVELTTQAISSSFLSGISATTTVSNTELRFDPLNLGGVDYNITHSPNPHTHTATTNISVGAIGTMTYRVVSSGLLSAFIRYNSIVLPNKNTGALFTINTNNWKLSAVCSRSF